MHEPHRAVVDAIRANTLSGATALVLEAAGLLLAAGDDRAYLEVLAEACVAAQPTMAGMRTLRQLAAASPAPPAAIRQFREQVRRAPDAIARFAKDLLLTGAPTMGRARPALRLATVSRSQAVEKTVGAICRDADVTVCCAESRPRREGIGLAEALRDLGATVELWSDAGISAAIPGCDALVFGADAVGPDSLVNKVGTAALCALAIHLGIPAYALAGRDKFLTGRDMDTLTLVEGRAELDGEMPVEVAVRNPVFEYVAKALITAIVTDRGVIALEL
jgi:translation initiation factor 2B subunit (eIF-2B alpha/beta/delta family)